MAAVLRGLARVQSLFISEATARHGLFNGIVGVRSIFTERALGITNYENARLSYRNQFANIETSFRTKMSEVCSQPTGMIFTEDLKAMLHLLQKRDEDLQLIEKMLEKFSSQDDQFRFGNFVFGPVIMRMFYYLDEPDTALKLFKNPQMGELFSQQTSGQVLMSLLLKHRRYKDVRDVYDLIKSKQETNVEVFARNTLILAMATCYKENSSEALEYAVSLWKTIMSQNRAIPRRAVACAVALAINQGAPHIGVEMLSTIRMTRSIEARCLRVLAYTKLQKFTEIIPIIRPSLDVDSQLARKEMYFSDVIGLLESEAKTKQGNEELLDLVTMLKRNNHIAVDTLDNHLSRPMDMFRMQKDGNQQGGINRTHGSARFNQHQQEALSTQM